MQAETGTHAHVTFGDAQGTRPPIKHSGCVWQEGRPGHAVWISPYMGHNGTGLGIRTMSANMPRLPLAVLPPCCCCCCCCCCGAPSLTLLAAAGPAQALKAQHDTSRTGQTTAVAALARPACTFRAMPPPHSNLSKHTPSPLSALLLPPAFNSGGGGAESSPGREWQG